MWRQPGFLAFLSLLQRNCGGSVVSDRLTSIFSMECEDFLVVSTTPKTHSGADAGLKKIVGLSVTSSMTSHVNEDLVVIQGASIGR